MSEKILVDKKGLDIYHNDLMNYHIKPLQDSLGLGNGFNPREEIEQIKTKLTEIDELKEEVLKIDGLQTDLTSLQQNLTITDEIVFDMVEEVSALTTRVTNLENTVNTLFKEEVLFSGEITSVNEVITFSDDYTKFVDLKIHMDALGFVIVPFDFSSTDSFIFRTFNLADNPTSSSTIYFYELQIQKIDNKSAKVKLTNQINFNTQSGIAPVTSTLKIQKITGRRIKK